MLNIAVLVSGGGTNLQALIDAQQAGMFDGRITSVISSKPGVYALERARNNGIPTRVSNAKILPRPSISTRPCSTLLKAPGPTSWYWPDFLR